MVSWTREARLYHQNPLPPLPSPQRPMLQVGSPFRLQRIPRNHQHQKRAGGVRWVRTVNQVVTCDSYSSCDFYLTCSTAPQPVPVQPAAEAGWPVGQGFQEFVPQTEYSSQMIHHADPASAAAATMLGYTDPFTLTPGVQGIPNNHVAATLNPYAQDTSALSGATYFQNAGGFTQPVCVCSSRQT